MPDWRPVRSDHLPAGHPPGRTGTAGRPIGAVTVARGTGAPAVSARARVRSAVELAGRSSGVQPCRPPDGRDPTLRAGGHVAQSRAGRHDRRYAARHRTASNSPASRLEESVSYEVCIGPLHSVERSDSVLAEVIAPWVSTRPERGSRRRRMRTVMRHHAWRLEVTVTRALRHCALPALILAAVLPACRRQRLRNLRPRGNPGRFRDRECPAREERPMTPMPPASMSKIMTVYLAFERLKEGRLRMEDVITISRKARRMGGSRMFVEVNSQVSVADILRGIIVQSGKRFRRSARRGACRQRVRGSPSAWTRRRANSACRRARSGTRPAGPIPNTGPRHGISRALPRVLFVTFPNCTGLYAETSFTLQ